MRRRAILALSLGMLAGLSVAAAALEPPLDRYVFVANRTSADIAVIDTTIDEVVERVELDAIPRQYLLSEDRGKLIASHVGHDRLTIFGLEAMQTTAVLDLGFAPETIESAPDGAALAVANAGAGVVVLVSLADEREIWRREGLAAPSDLIFDRDAERLFVASGSAGRIAVLDAATGALQADIALGDGEVAAAGIRALTRTPGGQLGFALHGASGAVSVLDLRTLEQLATVRVPGPAVQAYPGASSQFVLVPNERDRSVSLISTWSYRESARLPGAADVSGINVGMFDTVGFVLGRAEDKAVILDLANLEPIGELALPARPETGISAAAGTKLYVALAGSDRVAVIDMRERRLVRLIDGVGTEPWGVNRAGGLSYCH